jgi:hypothetical protein
MTIEIALLATAIFVLTIGLALISWRMQDIELRIKVSNIRIDNLRERMLINDKFDNSLYHELLSLSKKVGTLEKEIYPTDTDVKI